MYLLKYESIKSDVFCPCVVNLPQLITYYKPFRLEVAACAASIPGKVKSFLYYIARPSVAHPVKG
jgi:hypothetical protein